VTYFLPFHLVAHKLHRHFSQMNIWQSQRIGSAGRLSLWQLRLTQVATGWTRRPLIGLLPNPSQIAVPPRAGTLCPALSQNFDNNSPGALMVSSPFAQRFNTTHRERLETLRGKSERGAR
jgi:hypothetical protein